MRQHNINALICDKHLPSQISECPACVREERDRLRDEQRDWAENFVRIVKDDRAKDEVHCPCCVELRLRHKDIVKERDRYRKVLEEIIKHSDSPSVVTHEAEKALEGKE